MVIKEKYVAPDFEEVRCATCEVLCESQTPEFNSPTFGGMENDNIF